MAIVEGTSAVPESHTHLRAWIWLKGCWTSLKSHLVRADQSFVFLKNLSIVGLVTALIGAYFQYTSWLQEHSIQQYKDNFSRATEVFEKTSSAMSSAMHLQQILFGNYRSANIGESDPHQIAFIAKNGNAIYKDYVDARTSFRQNIDVYARKLEIYVDWPFTSHELEAASDLNNDPISYLKLREYDFDCQNHMPTSKPGAIALAKPKAPAASPDLKIDWSSAKHQALAFYYCFEKTHTAILVARQWASGAQIDPAKKIWFTGTLNDNQELLNKQAVRMDFFMLLVMRRIGEIRLKYQPKGFLCHLLPWCR